MGYPLFKVVKKGLYTTYQDLGRYGYQRFGVVTGGAMDTYSCQIANILVGNRRDEACLEVTMIGPELAVEADSLLIAVCGADLGLTVNDTPAPLWRSFVVQKGDVIRFGRPTSGVRAYLAVSGGFTIPEVLGSKSFFQKAKLGTEIAVGDVLDGIETRNYKRIGINQEWIPRFERCVTIRTILGPHNHLFTNESIQYFLSDSYVVIQGDRMGYRLKGPTPLKHINQADIASDAIPLGGIQVPSNGEPIILLSDRQTTGGYTRIANVISVDMYKIAQLPTGGTIQFEACTINKAHELIHRREQFLKALQMA
ncbi:biotin-dependent carboxyltransferase family protein [Ferdinandcohnia quinoae]|uniref:Biotin-dependent carboxyltransferase family protein n=1 Tax=Fredinandcohnia quinoae TaxID=2918902 RepID=A0AAW5EAJ1_9BACI|nr:biotin-dependent carboxyltransferase family protein [Fredinandcohnia sp. SECRCQ15]MCH1626163.1 biotin-dependent carboxyltransferase family protein [Fredinandcohnia sp. SECRCQ15]